MRQRRAPSTTTLAHPHGSAPHNPQLATSHGNRNLQPAVRQTYLHVPRPELNTVSRIEDGRGVTRSRDGSSGFRAERPVTTGWRAPRHARRPAPVCNERRFTRKIKPKLDDNTYTPLRAKKSCRASCACGLAGDRHRAPCILVGTRAVRSTSASTSDRPEGSGGVLTQPAHRIGNSLSCHLCLLAAVRTIG